MTHRAAKFGSALEGPRHPDDQDLRGGIEVRDDTWAVSKEDPI